MLGKNYNGVFQTIKGHTIDCLKVFRNYLGIKGAFIKNFCKRWGLDYNKFIKNMFVIIYLHDVAKHMKSFQENIAKNKASMDYPHAYHFLYIAIKAMQTYGKIPYIEPLGITDGPYLEICVVLSHHSQLHRGIYDKVTGECYDYNDCEVNKFIKNIENVYSKLDFSKFFKLGTEKLRGIRLGPGNLETMKKFKENLKSVADCHSEIKAKTYNKAVFTYMLSILKYCDSYASKCFEEYAKAYAKNLEVYESIISDDVPIADIQGIDKGRILGKNTAYPYQKEALQVHEDTIIVAGCGRGKTETALIIANNIIKQNKAKKIVFAMPTQVTSNAMAERLKIIFGSENVALYHGKALIDKLIELGESSEADEEEYYHDIKSELYLSKTFCNPVTVTTVDHVIYSFIHAYRQSDFSCGNIQEAVIVFDEIHYYEKHTTEIIFDMLCILREMKIPHIIMSATIPDFIIKDCKKHYKYLEDEEGLTYKPFVFKKVNHCLLVKSDGKYIVNSDFLNRVKNNYERGMRQIVIVNSVEKAQVIYEEICRFLDYPVNIILFHSRFTAEDRKEKENIINNSRNECPYIIVSTQIIEVSIDVSCNIMYTEVAPLDALAQRGGRLNRKGKSYMVDGVEQAMYVYYVENFLPYATKKQKDKIAVMEKTFDLIMDEPVSYLEVKNKLNEVYKGFELGMSQFFEYFKNASLFGNSPDDVKGKSVDKDEGGFFSTREANFYYLDVVPQAKYSNAIQNINLLDRYVTKLPYYYYEVNKDAFYISKHEEKNFIVCKYNYSFEKGISISTEDYYKSMDTFL